MEQEEGDDEKTRPAVDPSAVEEYIRWLNGQVAEHGAPPAWLRTTTTSKGSSRAVRVPTTAADVAVSDSAPPLLSGLPSGLPGSESSALETSAASQVAMDLAGLTASSTAAGQARRGEGPHGVTVIRMNRGGSAAATDAPSKGVSSPIRLVIVSDRTGSRGLLPG